MLIHIFSSNVKYYRKKKGISQEELANLSKLHRTYISGIELGQRNISLKTIEKIAGALKIPAYYLLIDNTGGKLNGK